MPCPDVPMSSGPAPRAHEARRYAPRLSPRVVMVRAASRACWRVAAAMLRWPAVCQGADGEVAQGGHGAGSAAGAGRGQLSSP